MLEAALPQGIPGQQHGQRAALDGVALVSDTGLRALSIKLPKLPEDAREVLDVRRMFIEAALDFKDDIVALKNSLAN